MTGTITFRRKAADRVMKWTFTLCALLVVLPLFLIFFDLLIKGAKELRWSLLVDLPHPVGEPGGGIANGILGTFVITLLTMTWSVPVAVMSGIYLAEYGRGKFASAVRFAVDTLTGVPSIIMGIFAYVLLVLPMKRFSAWAGAAALSMIFIPVVVRTTEDMLRTVPTTVRRRSIESASRQVSSSSGKRVPMSPDPAAPSRASITAWVSTSASEWPSRPRECSISTPPRTRRRPAAKRWLS